MVKRLAYFLFFFFISMGAFAQTGSCGTEDFLSREKSRNQDLSLAEQRMNNLLYQARINSPNSPRSLYTIPVVFHVIHQNGPENIPDSMLEREIDILNLRFQNAAPYFDTSGSDMEIQFCLASLDPWGNPTNGITRDTSVWTDIQLNTGSVVDEDLMMKNVNRWNPYAYLNIWVIRSVTGSNSPYSSLPYSTGSPKDGIVFSYGSIGGNSLVLSHEVGHYLGLYHTFQSYPQCINFNCLLDGDFVCDTPPDTLTYGCWQNTCTTDMTDTSGFNPFSGDVPDFPSYMGSCWKAFSPGQKARMHDAIINLRFDLLQSNACGANPGQTPPQAIFTHTTLNCGIEQFVSNSVNAQYTAWDFNSDGVTDATGDSVTWQYSTPGTYTITLSVFNLGGGDSSSLVISSFPPLNDDYPLMSVSQTNYSPVWGEFACYGKTIYAYADNSLSNILWSTGDTTSVISFVADTSFTLWVQGTDSTGHLWTMCNGGFFLYVTDPIPQPVVYALQNDTLCLGDTAHFVADLPAGLMMQGWKRDIYFFGTADTNFYYAPTTGSHTISARAKDANNCQVFSEPVFVYASLVAGPFSPAQNGLTLQGISGWNNQWYLDNVLIPGATQSTITVTQAGCYRVASWLDFPGCAVLSDSVCFVTVGNNDLRAADSWNIGPNPAFEILNLSSYRHLNENIALRISDMNGKSLIENTWANFSGKESLSMKDLSAGIYFLQITTSSEVWVQKIFVTR